MAASVSDTRGPSSTLFLPNFCESRAVLAVVLIVELVALMFAISRHALHASFWLDLAGSSLFLLWIGLTCAAALCRSRAWLHTLPAIRASLIAMALMLACVGAISEIVYQIGQFWSRDRHVQIQQKHSWKEEGRGARFLGNLLWGMPGRDAAGLRVAITSLTRGARPGELLYALDTEGRTAVCLFRAEDASERRLLHGSAQRLRDVRTAPGREQIACSVQHPDGTASIAIMSLDATDLREVTEGDVQDRFPAWAPGPGARLVYQSASLGRDGAGRPSAMGPSEVHLLDLESGALETLASDGGHDFVSPQLDAQGTLYCIRRPHHGGGGSFLGALLQVVLVPARLLFAVFQYLNFFSARYTGKPLLTAGARQKGADMRQMMQWSNLMEADQAATDEPPPAVPRSWQLVRIRPGARPETIAEGVVAFDLVEDGSLVYSTGNAIHHLGNDGRHQRLLGGERVEALVAFS